MNMQGFNIDGQGGRSGRRLIPPGVLHGGGFFWLPGRAEFHRLADVPPEVEWFANLSNAHTRRVYKNAIKDFMGFTGIVRPEEFRTVTRAHIMG